MVGKVEAKDFVHFFLPLSWRLKMARNTIPMDRYIEAAQVFHWATKEHFSLWVTGRLDRHRRTESGLYNLVLKDRLRCVRVGQRLVYTDPRRNKGKIPNMGS